MESILLDIMFDLPGLEGVKEMVISRQVVDGIVPPLYIYADRSDRTGDVGRAPESVGPRTSPTSRRSACHICQYAPLRPTSAFPLPALRRGRASSGQGQRGVTNDNKGLGP